MRAGLSRASHICLTSNRLAMRHFLAIAVLFFAASAAAAEPTEEAKAFRAAKAALIQQLRSAKADVRLGAVRKLGGYPLEDAWKTLLHTALASADDAVRKAAYEALAEQGENDELAALLATEVEQSFKKANFDASTGAALALLLASDAPAAEAKADKLLQQALASKAGPVLLIGVVDELGAQASSSSFQSLLKLKKLAPFDQDFGYRRAVVQALIRIRLPEAVSLLVETLENVQGEVRADILNYLRAISGMKFESDLEWRNWWEKAKTDFEFPKAPLANGAAGNKAGPSYYGLPLYGSKIVFVIDTSGSMRGPRIDAAKRELTKAIGELPDGVQFNVLAFNVSVISWKQQLVVASRETRTEAAFFVQAQQLGPATASYDALDAALTFPGEAVYFLTDGAPAGGKITRPDEIVNVISRMNRVRRMTINCIGIGVGPENGGFAQFLKTLAAQNFGAFRRVDE